MNLLNIANFLLFLIFQKYTDCAPKNNYSFGVRFKAITCQADNKTIVFNFCNLKPVSRTTVFLNIGFKVTESISKPIYVQMILNYKYGTIFRQVLDTKQLEWCALMDGSESNLFIKLIIDQIRGSIGDLFHKCPYSGEINLKNVTLDSTNYQKNQLFPEGNYRIDIFIYKNNIEKTKIIIGFELKTPLKESFG